MICRRGWDYVLNLEILNEGRFELGTLAIFGSWKLELGSDKLRLPLSLSSRWNNIRVNTLVESSSQLAAKSDIQGLTVPSPIEESASLLQEIRQREFRNQRKNIKSARTEGHCLTTAYIVTSVTERMLHVHLFPRTLPQQYTVPDFVLFSQL